MRQFPQYDALHELMDRLASTFPICINCHISVPPKHIICMESFQGRLRAYRESGMTSVLREYLQQKEAFMSSEKSKIAFIASQN